MSKHFGMANTKKKVMAVHILILFYITSWKTMNLPYQSLQVLREVEQKCLSSSLVMTPILLRRT